MNSSSTFRWEFDGTGNTMDITGGDLTLANGWKIELIDLGDDPLTSEKYNLFTYTGTGSLGSYTVISDLALDWDLTGLSIVNDGLGNVYITGVGTTAVIGDANGDGVVDGADYIIVKENLGQATGAGVADGDFDEDGTVEWDDLQTLIGAMNPAGGTTIPEPATLGLLTIGALAVVRRRRK
jgi:hypothetical protein